MNPFDNIIGRKIIKVQRIDSEVDYEFYTPYALIFTLDQLKEKLVLTATNDGSSTDIRLSSDFDIEENYGLELSESILNDLKPEDELNQFQNQKIENLKIAEFIQPEIEGNGFLIRQGKIAGIELKTENNKILFQNKNRGWIYINEDKTELPNKDRWKWK